MSKTELNLEILMKNSENLTQYILDPTSFNLPSRVHRNDPVCQTLFKLSRDMCFSIHNARMKKLKEICGK